MLLNMGIAGGLTNITVSVSPIVTRFSDVNMLGLLYSTISTKAPESLPEVPAIDELEDPISQFSDPETPVPTVSVFQEAEIATQAY